MKSNSLILVFCILSLTVLTSGKRAIDERLVGRWWGSEKDEQVKGILVKWVQQRNADGTVVTTFIAVDDSVLQDTTVEKGIWWVHDGKFYEQVTGSKRPDVYTYQVIDKNHIHFKAKKLKTEFENQNYQFIDTRVEK